MDSTVCWVLWRKVEHLLTSIRELISSEAKSNTDVSCHYYCCKREKECSKQAIKHEKIYITKVPLISILLLNYAFIYCEKYWLQISGLLRVQSQTVLFLGWHSRTARTSSGLFSGTVLLWLDLTTASTFCMCEHFEWFTCNKIGSPHQA